VKHRYRIGDIIHHKRYDYRGVIAGWDPFCKAGDEWYQKNVTQPRRKQPWYHVLVDGGPTTYVAEENLESDSRMTAVHNPLIPNCFVSFYRGRYYKVSMN